jgi:hypothetical protein
MPTGRRNQQSILFSVRLPLALAEQVDAYARARDLPRNQAFADLVRRGLNSGTPSDTPGDTLENTPSDTPNTVANLITRVQALESAVAELKEPGGIKPAATLEKGVLDDSASYLGRLCPQGHDWQGTGMSRRSRRNNLGCVPSFTHGVWTRPVQLMNTGDIRADPDVRFHASSETPCG